MPLNGRFVGAPSVIPMSPATRHHEAGHAVAIEHYGMTWVIFGQDEDLNRSGSTAIDGNGEGVSDFDLAVIAMSGWAAECQFLGRWDDEFVREQAQHDFDFLNPLDEKIQNLVTQRAQALVASKAQDISRIADAIENHFG